MATESADSVERESSSPDSVADARLLIEHRVGAYSSNRKPTVERAALDQVDIKEFITSVLHPVNFIVRLTTPQSASPSYRLARRSCVEARKCLLLVTALF